nr:trypsin-like peptidase domain-containing protein [Robertkochia sp. 3YJGBD-33]
MKRISSLFLVSLFSGALTLGAYIFFFGKQDVILEREEPEAKFVTASYDPNSLKAPDNINFTEAAKETVNAVVHVKNLTINRGPSSIRDFIYGYGGSGRAQVGTGSGVIISPDGYIVTNNHVIANSSELQITLNNNKTYKAELIGADAETDIALLKVEAEEELPFLVFGDSNYTQIGEWVLAVGNPFNLTSTVTAGIISAKARDLNEYDTKFQSFIQTDAAVNPGNSGGALVNINGELIGINTAITSSTGSYVGYSFAVPSNIAKKVVEDLMEYGNVQTGILGINGSDLGVVNPENLGVTESQGIYIADVVEDSGADRAGLQSGDIIKEIDQVKIRKFSDLAGYLRSKRPDDEVVVTILRDDETLEVPVTLLKDTTYKIEAIDLSVKEQSRNDRKRFGGQDGVKIVDAGWNLRNQAFTGKLLIQINDTAIKDVDDVKEAMEEARRYGVVSIVTMDESGERERLIFRD